MEIHLRVEAHLFNILTHAVIERKAEEDILNHDLIGQKLFEQFAKRLDGNDSVWDLLKKAKISSFMGANKTINVTTEKGKLIVLKEERNLLQRFIIIARSRTKLNLVECIGEFEFNYYHWRRDYLHYNISPNKCFHSQP